MDSSKGRVIFIRRFSPGELRPWLWNTVIGLAGLILCFISPHVGGSTGWLLLILGLLILAVAVVIEVGLWLRGRAAPRSAPTADGTHTEGW